MRATVTLGDPEHHFPPLSPRKRGPQCGDVSAPAAFGVNRFGWAPTVQLTAHLQAMPADGWLRIMCTTVQIGQDWFG